MESFFEQLKAHLLTSWKTTVTGFISGLAVIVAQFGVAVSPAAQTKISTWVVAAGLALIGFFSKDANKSGQPGA